MRITTGNVFITKSLPAIEQMFFKDDKVDSFNESLDLLEEKDLKNSFIASPFRNDGLMHFEYSFTANSQKNGGSIVTLRLLETSKLLEMFLLENDPLVRLIENRSKELSKAGRIETGTEGANVLNDRSYTEGLSRSSRYYFSFGVGDDISKWSGPYVMQLAGASLKNDENNVRSIEVTFISNTDSMKSWSSLFGHQFGYNEQFKDLSEFVTSDSVLKCNSRLTYLVRAGTITTREIQEAFRKNKLRSAFREASKEYYLNLDITIRKLLEGYIDTFTKVQGNSVVVLPQKFGDAVVSTANTLSNKYKLTKQEYKEYKENGIITGTYARKIPPQLSRFLTSPMSPYVYDIEYQTSSIDTDTLNKMGIDVRIHQIGSSDVIYNISENIKDTFKVSSDYLKQLGSAALKGGIAQAEDATTSVGTSLRNNLGSIASEEFEKIKKREDELFQFTMEQQRDNAIDSAELLLIKKIQIAGTERANFLEEVTNLSEEELLGTRKYTNVLDIFYAQLFYSTDAVNIGYPKIEPSNIKQLLQIAAELQFDRAKEVAEKEETRLKEQADATFERNIKPDSQARNKFKQDRRDVVADDLQDAATTRQDRHIEAVEKQLKYSSNLPKALNFIDKKLTSFWDHVSDLGNYADELKNIKSSVLMLTLDNVNEMGKIEGGYEGFNDLVSPLIRFASTLKSLVFKEKIVSTDYDFYEETNYKILKLWHKHGIIRDPSKPAYVFGNMDQIKTLLYLGDGNIPEDQSKISIFAADLFEGKEFIGEADLVAGVPQDELKYADNNYKRYVADFTKAFPKDPSIIHLRHNTADSNVISLDYRIDNYIAALSNMPINPKLDQISLGTTRIAATKEMARRAIKGKVLEKLSALESSETVTEAIGKATTAYDLALAVAEDPALVASNDKNIIDLFSIFLVLVNFDMLSEEANKSGYHSVEREPGNPEEMYSNYYKAILDHSLKLLYKVRVRSVPLFMHTNYLRKPCKLEGLVGKMVGNASENTDVRTSKDVAPYTGAYTAMGYRHVISPTEMYSEFDLYRQGHENRDQKSSVSVKEYICKILNDYINVTSETNNNLNEQQKELAKKEFGVGRNDRGAGGLPETERDKVIRDIRNNEAIIEKVKKALEKMGCEKNTE
jgi:hypothetical protein